MHLNTVATRAYLGDGDLFSIRLASFQRRVNSVRTAGLPSRNSGKGPSTNAGVSGQGYAKGGRKHAANLSAYLTRSEAAFSSD